MLRAPAHPAPQLVEIGQPEPVGVVDEDRIDIRDVEPGLDNVRREEKIDLVRDEIEHDPLQLLLVHLAVRDRNLHVRQDLLQVLVDDADVVNNVVDEEDLPSPGQLVRAPPS